MGGIGDFFNSLLGGGDAATGDSTTTSTPWAGLQPYLLDAFKQAQNIYNSGGPQFYPDATYVPWSPQTQMGASLMENRVLQGSPYQDAAGNFVLNQLNGSGGIDIPRIQAAGMNAASVGRIPTVRSGPGVTGNARQALNQTAGGNYLNANPYLDATYDRASDAVTRQWNESVLPGVNSTFSLAGRTGSDAHQNSVNQASEQLGDTLSDLGNQVYGGNYQSERDRMLQSGQGLGSLDLTAQGQALQASEANAGNQLDRLTTNAGLLQGARQFNAGNRQQARMFNAGNSMVGQQQNIGNQFQASNLGMGLANQDYTDIGNLFRLGGMVENQAGNVMQDSRDRFDFAQNAPERNFSNYIAWLGGIPGAQYGTVNNNVDSQNGSSMGQFFNNLLRNVNASGTTSGGTNWGWGS